MITSFFAPKRKSRHEGEDNEGSGSSDTSTKALATAKRLKTVSSEVAKGTSSPEAQELMSTLTEESWNDALSTYTSKSSFSSLAAFVAKERESKTVYPPTSDTFTALNLVPLDKVKVVIVGQDPYHGPGQGHGLAFSVKKGIRVPPSLRNIYKELLENECGLDKMPAHGYLERWAKQGVLMLNSVLTVRKGEAFSHKGRGWEQFTDEVIRCLFTKRPKDAGGLVFLLWGKPASKKAESIINRYTNGLMGAEKTKTVVISSSHPSPLGATKTKAPFMGSKCFSRTNSALEEMGHTKIDWGLDGPLSHTT